MQSGGSLEESFHLTKLGSEVSLYNIFLEHAALKVHAVHKKTPPTVRAAFPSDTFKEGLSCCGAVWLSCSQGQLLQKDGYCWMPKPYLTLDKTKLFASPLSKEIIKFVAQLMCK